MKFLKNGVFWDVTPCDSCKWFLPPRKPQILHMKLLVMQLSHPPVTPSLFGPNILLNTLFANTLSLCSSLTLKDYVSHPYRTIGKIVVLYILTFTFLDSRREDKRFWTEW
jgi:hypothetical protein